MDVLDEALAGHASDDGVPSRVGARFATPSIFCFESVDIKRSPAPTPWLSASVTTSTPPPRPARPRRTLSARQRAAFDAFVQLGARISDDFTEQELRSMFRSLALRYHPDRHPASSDSERAHLSVRFTELHDAYELLKSIPVCSN